jgi:hypothetical protein
MNVWKPAPVEEVPSVVLRDWKVIELSNGDRHFVGWDIAGFQGRVSSKIVQFDKEFMRGVTRSGRCYQLDKFPGDDPDAGYVLQAWLKINGTPEYKDVSEEL